VFGNDISYHQFEFRKTGLAVHEQQKRPLWRKTKTKNISFRRRNDATNTLRCLIAMLPIPHGQRRGLTT